MENIELIKRLIRNESSYEPPSEVVDLIIEAGEEVSVEHNRAAIQPGEVNGNLFICTEGLFRVSWGDGKEEQTYGFGGPGTFFISPSSYLFGEPAYFGVFACINCKFIKINRYILNLWINNNFEMVKWLFNIAMMQFAMMESKARLFKGSPKERYKILLKNFDTLSVGHRKYDRPAVLKQVSSKVIASYLGITRFYLSTIKKEIIEEERAEKK